MSTSPKNKTGWVIIFVAIFFISPLRATSAKEPVMRVLIGNENKAKIRADGSLTTLLLDKSISGSIHKVGASLLGSTSCNGWDFWHYYDDKKIVPIDYFREKLRNEINA